MGISKAQKYRELLNNLICIILQCVYYFFYNYNSVFKLVKVLRIIGKRFVELLLFLNN